MWFLCSCLQNSALVEQLQKKSIQFSKKMKNYLSITCSFTGAHSEFFFGGVGWQAVSLRGGVTVMEKREILAGWVTKVCLKLYKKLA